MRLVNLKISNFRSIADATLDDCGRFNVLIGKNNSGKSNLLAAIDHVFRFINSQRLAIASPPWVKEVDAHNKNSDRSIDIKAVLDPGKPRYTETVVGAISSEFPQVANALPDPDIHRFIRIDIKVVYRPEPVQYLASISFMDHPEAENAVKILEIPEETAIEIATRNKLLNDLEKDSSMLGNFLEEFDAGDWERIRGRSGGPGPWLSMTRDEATPQTLSEVRRLVTSADSYNDARTKIDALRISLDEKNDSVSKQNIRPPLTAFAGPAEFVPDYVTVASEGLAVAKVLHLADRRQPIGSREASKLLDVKISRGGDSILRSIQETVRTLLGVRIDAYKSDRSTSRRAPSQRSRANLPDAELDSTFAVMRRLVPRLAALPGFLGLWLVGAWWVEIGRR